LRKDQKLKRFSSQFDLFLSFSAKGASFNSSLACPGSFLASSANVLIFDIVSVM